MAKGIVTINSNGCKSCELCVSVCPKQVIEIDRSVINTRGVHPAAVKRPEACICCASCSLMCPDGAITIQKEVG